MPSPTSSHRFRTRGHRPFAPYPRLRAMEAQDRRPEHCPRPCRLASGGLRKKGHAPPFARNGGVTGIPPSFTREQDTWDKPPPPQPPLPFARKGGEAQERGHATRDGVGESTHNAPSPLSLGTARATPEGTRWPPSRFARSGDTQTRGARGDKNGPASTPIAPRRHLHAGSTRTGGRAPTGAAPPSPRVGAWGQRANRNVQKRRPSPLHPT
ncbi:hypothetical protein EDB89DRAFT_2079798 [Lactarius sanguifluus]|nr:hypothetical protein EDB89DRAFT_2079798 [Lactarius sanguifluus]